MFQQFTFIFVFLTAAILIQTVALESLEASSIINDLFESTTMSTSNTNTVLSEGIIRTLYNKYVVLFQKPSDDTRFKIFSDNVQIIFKFNKLERGWKRGINEFTDLSFSEFNGMYLMQNQQNCSATHTTPILNENNLNIPDAHDWRDYGIVSPVKNQGHCGSCWTFSTTGCLEAHWKLYNDISVSLAEQQLVDCAQSFDNHGCNGGLPSHAFEYLKYAGGIESEDEYPYKAHDDKCHFDASKVVATVSGGAVNITALDEDSLTAAIYLHGPVSIAFQVANDFRSYTSGVYRSNECKNGPDDVNHAVLAVGYGKDEEGTPYYIVKNSWGTGWGDGGYFKIERGVNMCGVAQCNSFPDVRPTSRG